MDKDIRDSYSLSLPSDKAIIDGVKNEMMLIKDQQGIPALEIVIDATHGGYVNSNLNMYSKEGQQTGAKTFFTPFPKPVLVEHDDTKSPIGRVVDAQYVDIPVDGQQMANAGIKGRPQSKITVKTIVTEPDAIQKLMDGRFLTVSISGRPKTAPICSVCNAKVDGPFGCENDHVRGKMYDDKLCYYIIGEMNFSEVSFVNKPADQSDMHAAMIISMKGITAPSFAQIPDKIEETAPVISDSEEPCPECEEKFWSDAEVAELKTVSDEYDKWLESDDAKDAKLSAEQRKGMKSSTFCGPNRSFPVPDCKHVTAARRLIGKASVSSSTKAKILACVSRKAKTMACSTGDSEEAMILLEEAKNQMAEQIKVLTEEKKQAEELLRTTNEKMEKTLADLTKMQDELTKLKETVTVEATKVAAQTVAAENQHKQDLEQNKLLTVQVKEKVAANIVTMSLLLQKDGFLNVFGGNTVEDRVKSHSVALSKYKETPLEDLIKMEKQYLDELTKVTMVGHKNGPITGPESDPMIAEQIKTYTSKKEFVTRWWNG